jgi:hypothetical protein
MVQIVEPTPAPKPLTTPWSAIVKAQAQDAAAGAKPQPAARDAHAPEPKAASTGDSAGKSPPRQPAAAAAPAGGSPRAGGGEPDAPAAKRAEGGGEPAKEAAPPSDAAKAAGDAAHEKGADPKGAEVRLPI